jgi:peptide deformylase
MSEILEITRFGNPILREVAKPLTVEEIVSDQTQLLIANMRHTLTEKQYGVGIAAPQVGESLAISVVGIKPTPNRPGLEPFETVLINPEIVETYGAKVNMWEACVSCGTGDDILFAKVPRFAEVKLRWLDEQAQSREEVIGGFVAQVVQHETDHLQGTLFVDHVQDAASYMMADEYRQRILGL